MRTAETLFFRIPRIIAGLLLLASLGVNIANVIARYLFRFSLYWADEAMVFLALWSAALAGVAIAFRHAHLNMDLFVERAPPAWRGLLFWSSTAATVAIFALMAWLASRAIALFATTGQVSVAIGLPMTIPHAALATGFALAALAVVVRAALERGPPPAPDIEARLKSAV